VTTWLDKLNLQPQERRAFLIGVVIVALVFNYWFIWPYFLDWEKTTSELNKLNSRLAVFRAEIGKKASYEKKLKELEKAGAGNVLEEEQANRMQGTVLTQAATENVSVDSYKPVRGFAVTNSFFNEEQATLDVRAGEAELINFLYAIGSGDSRIRVKDMSGLGLDPTQQRLKAKLTLIASFQRKTPAATTNVAPRVSPPKDSKAPNATTKSNGIPSNSTGAKTSGLTGAKSSPTIKTNSPSRK
jgi:hypothetical protein